MWFVRSGGKGPDGPSRNRLENCPSLFLALEFEAHSEPVDFPCWSHQLVDYSIVLSGWLGAIPGLGSVGL